MRVVASGVLVVVWLIGMFVILDTGPLVLSARGGRAEEGVRALVAVAWMLLCSFIFALIWVSA